MLRILRIFPLVLSAAASLMSLSATAAGLEQARDLLPRVAGSKAASNSPAFLGALGLGGSEKLELVKRLTTPEGTEVTRYRQSLAGIPVWGRQIILERDASGAVKSLNGELVSDLARSITSVKPVVGEIEVVDLMRQRVVRSVGSEPVLSREKAELVIFYGEDGSASLAWAVEFLADRAGGGKPTRPIFIVDAVDGRVLKHFDALMHQATPTCTSGCTLLDQTGLSASRRTWVYRNVTIPSDAPAGSNLTVTISGGSGDADLYVRKGANPTTSAFNCRPYLAGNNESCTLAVSPGEAWYIGLYAYSAFSGVTLKASVTVPTTIERIGNGPGGNGKVGLYYYEDPAPYPSLNVQNVSGTCTMTNTDVKTVHLNGGTSGTTAFSYAADGQNICFNASDPANGAYSPLNDGHYFGGVVFDMYQAYLNRAPLSFQLTMRVHYGSNYENAFWDGSSMTFGDGASTFYPLVSLDVTAHEVSHGFTEQNSNLTYSGESGGMNEAFSDIAGEAAEFYSRGSADFLVGADIFKGQSALRNMCNPPADGASIDNVANFTANLDVHYSSGIYNKAFCMLAKTTGWDVKKAFIAFANANMFCWTSSTGFTAGAQCVVDKAEPTDRQAIADAFAVVGITGLNVGAVAPAAPTISLGTVTYNQVNLQWADVSNETGYRVERSTDGTSFSTAANLAAGATGYADSTVSASTSYWYRVVAINSSGESTSNTVQANTVALPNITLSVTPSLFKGKQRVALVWSGATTSSVDIWRNGSRIRTTTNTGSYTDQPSGSTSYIYKVCNAGSVTICSPERTASF